MRLNIAKPLQMCVRNNGKIEVLKEVVREFNLELRSLGF